MKSSQLKQSIETSRAVLTKYKLATPIPEEHKKYVKRTMRSEQIKILKKAGRYRPIYGVFLWVFYFLRDLGILVTVPQSAVIFFTASAIALGVAGTGGYVTVKHFVTDKPNIEETVKVEKTAEVKAVLDSKEPVQKAKIDISIKGTGIENSILEQAKEKINNYFFQNIKQTQKIYSVKGEIIFVKDDTCSLALDVEEIKRISKETYKKTGIYADSDFVKVGDIYPVILKMSKEAVQEILKNEKQ